MVWGSSEPPVELSPGTGSGGGGGGKSMCRAHTNPPPVSNSQLDFIHLNVAATPSVFALTFFSSVFLTKLEWHVWRMQNIDNNSTVTCLFQTNSVSTNVDWFCKKGQCKIDQLTEYQMRFHCDMLWHWR